jgi:hypothetical protein
MHAGWLNFGSRPAAFARQFEPHQVSRDIINRRMKPIFCMARLMQAVKQALAILPAPAEWWPQCTILCSSD